jgi:hypothetical protein
MATQELLHPLTCIHFGGEDVALAIDGDVVKRREHAHRPSRPTEAAERFLRGAVDNAHLAKQAQRRQRHLMQLSEA